MRRSLMEMRKKKMETKKELKLMRKMKEVTTTFEVLRAFIIFIFY
jgi:hypothetical protein